MAAELTGPVQLLAVGFPAGARFEGKIAEELDKLESVGAIRILDFVFLHRDEVTGALVRMDYRGGEDEGHVTTMLEGAGVGYGSGLSPFSGLAVSPKMRYVRS